MKNIELTAQQKSFMDRIGRLSGRSAATALSQVLGRKANIRLSEIFFVPLEDIQYLLGDPGIVVAGVLHEMLQDVEGSLLTLMPVELARELLSFMLKTTVDNNVLASPVGMANMGELSNIICGSYVSTISNLLDMTIIPSIPHVTIDMMGAMTQDTILKLKLGTAHAMIIKTELLVAGSVISIHLLMLMEHESLDKLLDKINFKTGV